MERRTIENIKNIRNNFKQEIRVKCLSNNKIKRNEKVTKVLDYYLNEIKGEIKSLVVFKTGDLEVSSRFGVHPSIDSKKEYNKTFLSYANFSNWISRKGEDKFPTIKFDKEIKSGGYTILCNFYI